MRRIGAMVMVLLLLAVPGWAHETDDLIDLEAPLGALLGAYLGGGLAYPEDGEVSADYARTYLFYMANIFYLDDAQPLADVPDGFDRYAQLAEDEVALLLTWAFGALAQPGDLEPDGRTLIVRDGDYYVGVADGYPATVTYAGPADDGRYLYDYAIALSDGGERNGQLSVEVEETADPDAALSVAGFAVTGGAAVDDLAGNWYAPNGYWCSLMEEGLIFCFNDQYEVIAEGTFAADGEALAVTLNGEATQARIADGALLLAVDGVERSYAREES